MLIYVVTTRKRVILKVMDDQPEIEMENLDISRNVLKALDYVICENPAPENFMEILDAASVRFDLNDE